MSHHTSVELESLVRRALNTGWGGFGHVAHADHIDLEGGAYVAMIACLAPYYKESGNETKGRISDFIDRWRFLEKEKVRDKVDEVKTLVKELRVLLDELDRAPY